MPNWCSNVIYIENTKHDAEALRERLEGNVDEDWLLAYFIPEPKYDNNSDECPDWYGWRIENWGTKWEVQVDEWSELPTGDPDIVRFRIAFDSAWAPPVPVYEAMQRQGWGVDAFWWEPGMCFCGRWCDGDVEEWLTNDLDITEWKDTFPAVEEAFDMVNTAKGWMEDN